ncbi:MAG: fumarylacetoacetate hydrolase family protein [Pseudomonadota bacterium]
MRFVRFKKDTDIAYGIVEEDHVREIKGDIFSTYELLNTTLPLSAIKILPPCTPSKIIAVGLNYRSHAEELNMKIPEDPLIFMKPSTAVVGHEDAIIYPKMSCRVDYEGELAVIIGKPCRNVFMKDAPRYICGYTCINDVTARDLQKKDGQFTRSKSFDTFAPIGPFIETDLDPQKISIETFLNGEKKQSGSTSDFIFPVYHLVAFISEVMTLHPGDIISTGTPAGIGPMQVGDVVEIKVEGIGILRNTIARMATQNPPVARRWPPGNMRKG